MTKLEQVARALFDKASEDRPIYDRVSWDEIGPTGREHFMGLARVVVEALREPSAHMISEGYDHFEHGGSEAVWPAMVDAILSEKPDVA